MATTGNTPTADATASPERVALFVDTQNLYYAAKDAAGRFVDYQTLLHLALRGRALHAATAYVVEREGETQARGFITRLSTLGYRVKRKQVRFHHTDDSGRVVVDGDWDMGMAADMVRAFDQVQVLVLASGDGDFVPMLALAQERGLRVEALAFREATAQALIDQVDRFTNLSNAEGIYLPPQKNA